MVAYRNQHFVPEMYLRLFNGGHRHMIDIVPMRTGKLVRSASLHDQASRNWFYDDDGSVERPLSEIEGAAAGIIATMLERDRPPAQLSADHQGLVMFISIQYSRTLAAAEDANERIDKVAKSMIRESMPDNELISMLDKVRVTLKSPVSDTMRSGFLGAPLLYDLKLKMIINSSQHPFLASDAPVVMHNWLHDGTGTPATGYANSGLQIILPLGPWRALLMYDENAYDVGSFASRSVQLINSKHADLINELQWEAARNVMFVPPGTDATQLAEAWEHWRERNQDKVLVEHTVLSDDGSSKRTRLGVSSVPSSVSLRLPFVRLKMNRPPAWSGEAHAQLRHPEWAEYVTDLSREVESGRLHPALYVERTLKVPKTFRRR